MSLSADIVSVYKSGTLQIRKELRDERALEADDRYKTDLGSGRLDVMDLSECYIGDGAIRRHDTIAVSFPQELGLPTSTEWLCCTQVKHYSGQSAS